MATSDGQAGIKGEGMVTDGPSEFVVELLRRLREERFSVRGWWHFLWGSWEMAVRTAGANPGLRRSWMWVTTLMGGVLCMMLVAMGIVEGVGVMVRVLPGLVGCVVWQQCDLFWHLGLNRQAGTGVLLQRVGVANVLTGLRGLCAGLLFGRLLGGVITPNGLLWWVFVVAVATDILDGQVARWMRTQSRLGQVLDGETDFTVTLAVVLTLLQNGVLPVWVAGVMVIRFVVPLLGAVVCYFWLARPVRFSSTWWGKWAGVIQFLYIFGLLSSGPISGFFHVLNGPLLMALVVLLVVAPLAQVGANVRGERVDR